MRVHVVNAINDFAYFGRITGSQVKRYVHTADDQDLVFLFHPAAHVRG